ncbi:(d)CMP kinase [Aerococcaceae bacterium DSM 111021]|nr:(d)CMP kinase [Aerococcaceae bacterium DSM 111021]
MSNYQIAIDGPSSSGKSSVAQEIAKELNIIYIDTGAMYRAVTLAALQANIEPSDSENIKKLLPTIELNFTRSAEDAQEMYLNDKNVSREIRSDEVTANVSEVSAYSFVREELVEIQRNMASTHSVVMDGRDIGTVVLPNAPYKFFLNASAEVRAMRRYKENIQKGLSNQSLEEIEKSIIARDHYDSNREHSPLVKADDAIELETSNLSVQQVVNIIIEQLDK